MYDVYLVCSDFYYNNRIFDLTSPYNRDNSWYPNYLLKEKCFELGVELNTIDHLDRNRSIGFGLVFYDVPRDIEKYIRAYPTSKKSLIIWECPMINPRSWDKKIHAYFDKIDIKENRFGFETEITAKVAKLKCRIFGIGISYRGRTYEQGNKIGWKDGIQTLWCIVKYN